MRFSLATIGNGAVGLLTTLLFWTHSHLHNKRGICYLVLFCPRGKGLSASVLRSSSTCRESFGSHATQILRPCHPAFSIGRISQCLGSGTARIGLPIPCHLPAQGLDARRRLMSHFLRLCDGLAALDCFSSQQTMAGRGR